LKLIEHFSDAAAYVADGLRGNSILLKHAKNLAGLPRRLLNVPGRILGKVFPINVKSSAGHQLSV
jgi:hypothetical protein